MTDHSQNLKSITEARTAVYEEIQELQNAINVKRELFLKYSGIVEYFQTVNQTDAEGSNSEASEEAVTEDPAESE